MLLKGVAQLPLLAVARNRSDVLPTIVVQAHSVLLGSVVHLVVVLAAAAEQVVLATTAEQVVLTSSVEQIVLPSDAA